MQAEKRTIVDLYFFFDLFFRDGVMATDLQSFNSVVTSILTRFRSSLDVRVGRVPTDTYSLSLQKSDENSKRNGFKTLRARNQRQLSCQSFRTA